MDWIFSAFVGAAVLHVLEEYVYPGGFTNWMRRSSPRFAPFITTRFAVIINGLFLLLCGMGAIVASKSLVFSLSVASLLFVNGCIHLAGTIRAKRYAPGVVSGVLLYIPLSFYAFDSFVRSGQLSPAEGVISGLLGVVYNAVPISYLGLSSVIKRS
jgi:hypothetical protein